MARPPAPTKATGGGGYTFADKVTAAYLTQILGRAFPFEPALGSIVELHLETRESGQILDDLRLILISRQKPTSSRFRAALEPVGLT
jgi:hypothetical protein